MKAVVTGACGFIGSHMVEVLAREGHDVIACDLPQALSAPTDDRTRFPEVCRSSGAELRPLDLTDASTIPSAVEGAGVCFHVAAVFDYMAPESVLRGVNVEGTRSLLEVLVEQGTCRRVVNWGAGGIYGPPRPEILPFKEDTPKRPSNPYLASKWDQERLAHAYRARGLEVTSVRPTSPYGPRAAYGSGQLLMGFAERAHPVAFKNMTGNIPFVHVRDLCAAALHLASHDAADGESYNVSDDGRIDAIKLARIVASEMGTTPQILPPMPLAAVRRILSGAARMSAASAKRRGKRPLLEYDQVQYFGRDYRYSSEKLKATGFRFSWPDPEPELRATLRWYLDHGWLTRPEVSAGRKRVG
ncbi:MAG: NAD-dependent epimerase/dehydratase family protein [Actinomycetota bacterium]|nr:NAD-dependent epimerase/dehydratase family protein [Actinomycetota bacterium]